MSNELRSDHRPTVDKVAGDLTSVLDALLASIEFARRERFATWGAKNENNIESLAGWLAREGEEAGWVLAARARDQVAALPRYGGEYPYAGAKIVDRVRRIVETWRERPLTPWVWAEIYSALPGHKKVTSTHLVGSGHLLGPGVIPAMRAAIRRKVSFRGELFHHLCSRKQLTVEEALGGITDPPLREESEKFLAKRVEEVEVDLRDLLPSASKGTREVIVRLLRQVDKRIDADGKATGTSLSDLETRLRDDPNDGETSQVWADLMMDRGDPRGQIAALMRALAEETDHARALEISGELAELTAKHRKVGFGKPGGFPFREKNLGRAYVRFHSSWRGMIRGKPATILDRVLRFLAAVTDSKRPEVDGQTFKSDAALREHCLESERAVLRCEFRLVWPGTRDRLPYQEAGHYPPGGHNPEEPLTSALEIELSSGKLDLSLNFPFEDFDDENFVLVYKAVADTLGKIVLTPTGFEHVTPTVDGKKVKRKTARYAGK